MQFKDICSCKIYTDREGKEKKTWPKVGVLKTTESGKQFIELNLIPNQTLFVFDQKEKTQSNTSNNTTQNATQANTDDPDWIDQDQS